MLVVDVPDNELPVCPECGDDLTLIGIGQSGAEARRIARRRRGISPGLWFVSALTTAAVGYLLIGVVFLDKPIPDHIELPSMAGLLAPPVRGPEYVAPKPAAAPAPAPAPAIAPAPARAEIDAPVTLAPMPVPMLAPVAPTATLVPTPDRYLLRLAGTDATGGRLARRLAAGFLGLVGNSNISDRPGNAAGQTVVVGSQGDEAEAIMIAETSSSSGIRALLLDGADLAMAVRPIDAAEAGQLATPGTPGSGADEHVIGLEAITVIVAAGNPIQSLTVAQLRDILTGEVSDWSKVGGIPGPIRVVVPAGSGADAPAMIAMPQAGVTTTANRTESDRDTAAAVANDRTALGIVGPRATGAARPLAISDGANPAVAPTSVAISTENYPLTRRVWMYARPTGKALSRRFIDYIASPAGQAAIEASGLTPLTIKATPAVTLLTAKERFRQLTSKAERLPVEFRFSVGATALDSRAARDIERIAAFVQGRNGGANKLVLVAFTDTAGDAGVNRSIAQRRLDAVGAALGKAGLTIGTSALFGADAAGADTATFDSRDRSRTVEVYLAP